MIPEHSATYLMILFQKKDEMFEKIEEKRAS